MIGVAKIIWPFIWSLLPAIVATVLAFRFFAAAYLGLPISSRPDLTVAGLCILMAAIKWLKEFFQSIHGEDAP